MSVNEGRSDNDSQCSGCGEWFADQVLTRCACESLLCERCKTETCAPRSDRVTSAPDWQPISTAPKDFTPVLLVWQPPKAEHIADHDPAPCVVMERWACQTHLHRAFRGKCPNEADCSEGWGNYAGEMTHWMPLPSLPNVSRASRGPDVTDAARPVISSRDTRAFIAIARSAVEAQLPEDEPDGISAWAYEAIVRAVLTEVRRAPRAPDEGADAERLFRSADEVEAHYMPETHARRKSVEACDCECHKPHECIRCQHVHDADSRRPARSDA